MSAQTAAEERNEMAISYIKRIRNAGKREYATRYLKWILWGIPVPTYYGSYMAAQAVRMRLSAIMDGDQ